MRTLEFNVQVTHVPKRCKNRKTAEGDTLKVHFVGKLLGEKANLLTARSLVQCPINSFLVRVGVPRWRVGTSCWTCVRGNGRCDNSLDEGFGEKGALRTVSHRLPTSST